MAEDIAPDPLTDSLAQLNNAFNPPVEQAPPPQQRAGPLEHLSDTFGNPRWMDERIPQQDRVNDFIRARATALAEKPNTPDEWQKVADEAKQYFPGMDPETIKPPFQSVKQQALNQVRLGQAREKYKNFEESPEMTGLREGYPFLTTGWNFYEKGQYKDAKERLAKGEYNPGDYAKVAHFERLEANKQDESTGKFLARRALNVGSFLGEAAAGGGLLKAAGVTPAISLGGRVAAAEAEVVPTLAARIMGKTLVTRMAGQAAVSGGRVAAQTALMPSMWLPQTVDHALQNGGNWYDVKNAGPAVGMGMMQVGLLGAASKAGGSATASKLIPGLAEGGVEGWATRLVTGTGVAMTGQAGIDATNGVLTSQFPLWGHKGYGAAADLLQGKEGAPKAMLGQLVTFALFNLAHAHNNPLGEARAADAKAGQAIMDLGSQFVGRLKATGYGETAAYEKAMRAHALIVEAVQGKDIAAARAGLDRMTGQYVDALAEGMHLDQLAAEQKAADIAQRNPKVGDFRGQFGSEEAQTEQPTSQKPTPAPETPQTTPAATESAAAESTPEPANAPQAKAGTPWTPELLDQFADTVRKSGENPMEAVKRLGLTPEQANAVLAKLQQPAPPAPLSAEGQADVEAAAKSLGYTNAKAMAKTDPKSLAAITEAVRTRAATESESRKSAGSGKAPQVPRGTEGAERYYRTPESKGEGSNVDAAVRELVGKSFAGKWFSRTREGNAGYYKPGKVQFEFSSEHFRGEEHGDFVDPREKDVLVGGKAPMIEHPALSAIRYHGAEDSPDFARLKGLVEDANSVRAEKGLNPIKLEASAPEPPKAPEPSGPTVRKPVGNSAEIVRPHMNDIPQHIQDAIDAATDLTPREKAVLEGRAQGNSHQDLEAEFGVKRQRVEQIEKAAMAKLGVEHKSMADWLASKSPTGKTAHVDPEVIDSTVREAAEKEGVNLTDEEIRQLPPALRKLATTTLSDPDEADRLMDEALRSIPTSKGAKDAADAIIAERGGRDAEAIRREVESALQESLRNVQAGLAAQGASRAADQGPAVRPETAPAARSEAASRELKFRTVVQEVSARGGIDPKTFASIHGLEVTREFMKEFPGLFRGKNLRGGKNKFEELVPNLVEDGVFSVPDGQKPTDAFLDVIKAKALDMSQNLDAKYQQESERHAQQEAAAQQAGFSAEAVKGARAVGEELADLEESERIAEADRAVQGATGRGPAADAAGSVPELEEGQGSGDEGAGRPGAGEFDFGANAKPPAIGGGQPRGTGESLLKPGETALAFDEIDIKRDQLGLPSIMKDMVRSDPDVWAKVKRTVTTAPSAAERLVNELNRHPRPATLDEMALLLYRKVQLQNAHEEATRDFSTAFRKTGRPSAESRAAGAKEREIAGLIDLTDRAAQHPAAEAGRVLRWQRVISNADFTLSSMLRQSEAAKGKPLTVEESAQVEALQKRIAELEAQQGRGLGLDLTAKIGRLKQQFTESLNIQRWLQKPISEKAQDLFTKWRRASILSSPVTIAKLSSAALARMAFTPAEEAVGGVIGKVIPGIAGKAAGEGGGLSFGREVRAASKAITKGMADAWDILTTGKSELKVKYGTSPEGETPFARFLEIPGRIHGALKAMPARAAFERGVEKRTAAAIRDGLDPTDAAVSTRIMVESYKDSERSIFMQDNRVTEAWQRGIRYLERPDPLTGRVPGGAKALATGLKFALPIVKVPTNIVAETFTHAFGSVTGSVSAARAYARGIENLTPEQADVIMRQLKKGSLGAAVLALGFLNPDSVGGYYQHGQKRRKEDVEAGGIRLFGINVPKYMVHNPLLETLQIGATVRRAIGDKDDPDYLMSGLRALLGLGEEVPFVREQLEVAKAYDQPKKALGTQIKSAVVPAGVSWTAEQLDRPRSGMVIGPKTNRHVGGKEAGTAATVKEEVQSGIPWWRQGLRPK